MNKKKGLSGDIITSYLEKYPDLPSLTLSKIIYKENPSIFTNVETVRTGIRKYRGSMGKKNLIRLGDRRFIRETIIPYNPYMIPESDEQEFEPFEIYPQFKKMLVFGDVHIPYHNVDSINRMIEYALKHRVDSILINGDFMDHYQESEFEKDPRKRHFAEELQITELFLNAIIKAFGVKIFYKLGNHEERYQRYMRLKAPELIGIPEFELSNLLHTNAKNIDVIKDKRIIRFGKLNILHGHEMKGSIIPPVNAARGVFLKTMENTLVNHFHTDTKHSENSLNGHHVSCWSIGCLCELHPEYAVINKWRHGFAIVEKINDDGNFVVDTRQIIKGRVL
jgi:predicted phosphodiesterase